MINKNNNKMALPKKNRKKKKFKKIEKENNSRDEIQELDEDGNNENKNEENIKFKRALKKTRGRIEIKKILDMILSKYTKSTIPNTIFDIFSTKKLKFIYNLISCGVYCFFDKRKAIASAILSCINLLESD